MTQRKIDINVPSLARVEGEGALKLQIRGNDITELQLQIYEPPRLFEKFLIGREPNEVVDAVARICGICPVAYQMSAVHAIERVFDIQPGPWVREMRRLYYCGEWIESHTLHMHMLAAPDFLGYNSGMDMAEDYPQQVKRGMRLHGLGNKIMELLGKRSVHPVGACVGGFYHAPAKSQAKEVLKQSYELEREARDLVLWAASLPLPDIRQDLPCVSVQHPEEYPMNEGRIVSNQGLDISIDDFEDHFEEFQVPYSTAFHCLLHGEPYIVGPLARVNLNYHQLPKAVVDVMEQTGISWPSNNMYHSIVARAIEIYYCVAEAIRILQDYTLPQSPQVPVTAQAGTGFGATEAPRGLLWHRYTFDEHGLVRHCRIVPPTSQNQAHIEKDLRETLHKLGLDQDQQTLRLQSEKVIRNYDPCISCSTHFLNLELDRD